ncbi:hypothetical protein U91I_00255 [alpha proteobacterium U9-1i]|nr:hypothetical protein U91I_00255 [alpha proteobacterium U9-1i]
MKSTKALLSSALIWALCALPADAAGPGLEVAGERGATFIAKVCSPIVPNNWRSTTIVAMSWTIADCQSFARSIGATDIQLGCLFEEPQPNSASQRFSWGRRTIGVNSTASSLSLPAANCGWSL